MTPSRPRSRPSALRGDRGSATAETAIVLPVVVLLVVVLAFVGIAGAQQVRVESAARAVARELARGQDEAEATGVARVGAGSDARVAITRDGPYVRVEVTEVLRPAGRGPLAHLSVTVRGRATVRLEPQLLDQGSGP